MVLKFGAKEQFVGIFLVITLFILTGAIVFIAQGKNWFKKHEQYHTFFKEGYNLSPGANVTLYHTKIGKVVKVRLTEDNRVRVDLKILAKYASKMREDTIATVESPTIIGSEYIAILPGTTQSPLLPPGTEIISTEKKALSDYMKEFKIEEKVEILSGIMKNIKEITDRLKDPEGGLFGTLDNIKEMTARLKDPKGQIFTSLDNIHHMTDRLKDPKGELFQTLDNLASISQKMRKGEGSVGRLLIKDDLYRKIEEEINKVDSVLGNIELTTTRIPVIIDKAEKRLIEIKKPLTELDNILKDVPEIMNTVKRELDAISDILSSVKENFLIKRNLPPASKERSLSIEGRGE
jgi:phospholipid/cholesterol/gamma-HCH transport system substrate-binding protein